MNDPLPSRKFWRALIRIEDFNEEIFTLVIPGWNPNEQVVFLTSELSDRVWELASAGNKRFHAFVNIGAENAESLQIRETEHE